MATDAKASFSSKVEYRAVIRYLYLKGKTGQEIHCELINVYGSSAPSYAQVKFGVGEFKRGRTSTEDETRSGRPLLFLVYVNDIAESLLTRLFADDSSLFYSAATIKDIEGIINHDLCMLVRWAAQWLINLTLL